jgi:ATP-binding cassette subfamily C protein CydCD
LNLDKRLLLLVRSARFAFILTVSLGFAGGVLIVIQARLLSGIIARVYLEKETLAGVLTPLGILALIFVVRAAAMWGSEISGSCFASQIKSELRARLFRHLQFLGPAYLREGGDEKRRDIGPSDQSGAIRQPRSGNLGDQKVPSSLRTGELVNTAVEGIEALDAYFSQYLPQLLLAALIPLTYLAVVFPLDKISGIVLLFTAPLIPAFMVLIGDVANRLTKQRWERMSRMSAYFLDILQGLTTLKILGRSKDQIKVIKLVSERFRHTTLEVLRVAFLSALALEWVASLSTAVVAVEIGLRLLYGRLAFEQALFVLLLAPEFYLPLRALGTRFHAGMTGVRAAERIFQIISKPIGDEKSAQDTWVETKPAKARRVNGAAAPEIKFNGVSFSYFDGKEALRKVTCALPPAQRTALVGPSGAGKTTLTSLLLRFQKAHAGTISVNGAPLQEIPERVWLEQVSWVPQNPYLFNDSVEANIRLARPGATLEEIEEAAKLAYAHDFVQQFPEGYRTIVGERGIRLSAGQAQRIALARAFLKDAPLLILDEASANLDPESARLIQQAIDLLARERTALIIAHRLSSVINADQILVLDQGELQAVGKHSTLLESCPLYRKMVKTYAGVGISARPMDLSASLSSKVYHPETSGGSALLPSSPKPLLSKHGKRSNRAGGSLTWPHWRVSRSQALKRLLHLMAPFSGLVLLATVLGVATIASGIGLMTTSAYLISAAALQPSIAALQVAIVGVRAFGLSRGVFRYLERYVSHNTTFRLLAQLRVNFYRAVEPLAPARLTDQRSGDLLSRVTNDIESLENFYVRALAPPLVAILVFGLMTIFMARFHPSLALALLAFLLVAGAGIPALVLSFSRDSGRQVIDLRSALNVALIDGIQGMADLKIFGAERSQAAEVNRLSQSLGEAQKRLARAGGLQSALTNLLSNLGAWTILILAIPLVASDQLEGVYLAALVLGALSSFEAVLPLPLAAQNLEGNLKAAQRLFDLSDAEPEIRDPSHPSLIPQRIELSVQDLRFRYPEWQPLCSPRYKVLNTENSLQSEQIFGRGSFDRLRTGFRGISRINPFPIRGIRVHPRPIPYVLDGISFNLCKGSRIAIVGPSGAGKTTLVNLLLRFWEYREGQIQLGGKDIRDYRQEDLRQIMAVVSQNTFLFNASVRENLLLAKPEATEEEVVRAAEGAQIHAFIQSLPQGYDTRIGEQGFRLSAGERQRLAIARGLLKGAALLILDEPTAHLDALTEQAVLQAIFARTEGRATLLITHRLASLERMDEILVLDCGHVVERGGHAELLESDGLYRRMWDLQNRVLAEPF